MTEVFDMAQPDEKKTDQQKGRWAVMKEDLKAFCDTTSAHGLGHMSSSIYIIGRIFWAVAFLTAFCYVLSQAYALFLNYLSRPVSTKISLNFERKMKFPMIVVCNHNMIRYYKIADVFPVTPAGNDSDLDIEGFSDEDGIESAGIMNYIRTVEKSKLKANGHKFERLIKECKWKDDRDCKIGMEEYWRSSWHWKYGNCYLFNSGVTEDGKKIDALIVDFAGPKEGLKLLLNTEQAEYIGKMTGEAGVRVFIGTQGQRPSLYSAGFSLSPAQSYYVPMRKTVIERADPWNNGSCRKAEMDSHSIFKNISIYSISTCMYSCLANTQYSECNCTDYWLPTKGRVCVTQEDAYCSAMVDLNYQEGLLPCLKCPQPCSEVRYSYTHSSTMYPSEARKANMRAAGLYSPTDDKDILKARFFFDQMDVYKIEETAYYKVETFMGDFGGLLGLWTGISFLTVAEVIVLACTCIINFMVGRRVLR